MKLPQRNWGVLQLYLGREALEATIRRLVLALDPVTSEVGTVTRLVPASDRKTISAVTIRSPDGSTREVEAALVIDASGTTNGSACPRFAMARADLRAGINWLRKERYPEPVKQVYDPRIRYNCFTWQLVPATIRKFNALKNYPWSWQETGHLGSAFVGNHASSFVKCVRSSFDSLVRLLIGA
jgi:hypothetical protein